MIFHTDDLYGRYDGKVCRDCDKKLADLTIVGDAPNCGFCGGEYNLCIKCAEALISEIQFHININRTKQSS